MQPREDNVRVVVAGAKGRMGQQVVRAVRAAPDMELAGEADLGDDLGAILAESRSDALVDFTVPAAAIENIGIALQAKVAPVVGTSGIGLSELDEIRRLCRETGTGALVAPNFALGAVLMMQFAQAAARYFPDAEIVEMHHEQKLDSPSGTAMRTAELIAEGRAGASASGLPEGAFEKIRGARGASGAGEVPIHSVRLPGFVASQQVTFGGQGQLLTIRHDSIDRASFMAGVLLALRHVPEFATSGELIVGLEKLMSAHSVA